MQNEYRLILIKIKMATSEKKKETTEKKRFEIRIKKRQWMVEKKSSKRQISRAAYKITENTLS